MMKIPEIIALDIETTGLNSDKDRIWEIALLKIREREVVEKFTSLINPEVEIPEGIKRICGIKDDDLTGACFFKDVVEEINNFIKGKIILCHNAKFDINFLKKEFERCNFEFSKVKIIDTYLMAKKYFSFKSNSLDYLSKYYKLERPPHRAEKDAKIAYDLFEKLLYEMIRKNGENFKSLNYLFFYERYKKRLVEKIIFDIMEIGDKILHSDEILKEITKAKEEKREIMIEYINRKGKALERKILPLEIVEEGGIKYLKAFCYLRKEERKFRFDRIIKILENISVSE